MKIKIAVFIVGSVFAFNSCELFDQLGEVDFKTDFKLDYPLEVEQDDQSIALVKTFDITEDKEVEKYKENLEGIKVDSVMLGIKNLTGGDNISFTGFLKYSKYSENSGTNFVTINALNISELNDNQTLAKMPIDLDKIDKIANILENENKIKVYLVGTVSEAPVTCDISVFFYTTVTAQAI